MKLYVLRNHDGKFFRSIGYGGTGSNWVEGLDKAKFYTNLSQVKGRCTYFSKNPNFPVPEVLEFDLNTIQPTVLSMTDYTSTANRKQVLANAKARVRSCEYNLKWAMDHVDTVKSPFDRKRALVDIEERKHKLANAEKVLNELLAKGS